MSDRRRWLARFMGVVGATVSVLGCAAEPGVEAPPERSPLAPRHASGPLSPLAAPLPVTPVRAESSAAALIGLVASDDPAVTSALASGVRLAFSEARATGGPDLDLLVAPHEAHWASAAAAAVRMTMDAGALAVVTPPERRRAHELAQLGTRAGVPIVSTSPAPTVTQAGSTWVVSVVCSDPAALSAGDARFAAAFRAAAGHAPDHWGAVGYDAGRAVVEAVRRNGLRRDGLTRALAGAASFVGASGSITIESTGARREP